MKKRKFTKEDALYGVFAENSSSDDGGGSGKKSRSDKVYALYFIYNNFFYSNVYVIFKFIFKFIFIFIFIIINI